MRYLELFIFFIFIYLIFMKIKYNFLRKILIFFLMLFLFLDFIAIFVKGNHINYSFITNVDGDTFLFTLNFFVKQLIFVFIIFILIILFVIFYDKKIYKKINKLIKIYIYMILLVLNIIFSFNDRGIFFSIKSLFISNTVQLKSGNKKEALKNLGIDPKYFIEKENIVAEKGKNIVVIYLESLERGFLDMNITPNLNKLRQNWNYFEYETSDYSNWTMGAIFSTQTSFPMILGLKSGNKILKDVTDNEGVSIGLVLDKAGYKQVFLGGASLKFAGKGNFFKLNKYKPFGNEDWDIKYPRNDWGIYDYDLFEEAKKKYIELSKEKEPFNLTILTVDTHFPTGYPDLRLETYLKTKEKNMEYCIEATDYLVGNFIEFLKKQNNYKDTSVYILTDHLMMGDETLVPILQKLKKQKRGLFLITNEKNIRGYIEKDKPIFFFDIPNLILNGAKVKTNANFLKDLIPKINLENIENKVGEFLKLNTSFYKIKYLQIKSDIFIKRRSGNNKKLRVYNNSKIIDNLLLSENKRMIYVLDNQLTFNPAYETKKENPELKKEYGKLFLSLSLKNEDIVLELLSLEGNVYKTQVIKNSKISNLFRKKIFSYEEIKDLATKINIIYSDNSIEKIIKDLQKDILIKKNSNKIIFYDKKYNLILREI